MKKLNYLFIVVLMLFITQSGFGQITNTAHDFSTLAWNQTHGGVYDGSTGDNGEVCAVCHTPHNATASTNGPLWNRTGTMAAAGWTMYTNTTSSTFDGTMGAAPSGTSALCLSCHDGTVALNQFGGADAVADVFMTGTPLFDQSMDDDHPISFTYNAALVTADQATTGDASPGLNDPTSAAVAALLSGGASGTVECTSCHDIHNGGSGTVALLKIENSNSDLCLLCHAK